MNILIISGNHPRHLYLNAKLLATQNNIFLLLWREKLNPKISPIKIINYS